MKIVCNMAMFDWVHSQGPKCWPRVSQIYLAPEVDTVGYGIVLGPETVQALPANSDGTISWDETPWL